MKLLHALCFFVSLPVGLVSAFAPRPTSSSSSLQVVPIDDSVSRPTGTEQHRQHPRLFQSALKSFQMATRSKTTRLSLSNDSSDANGTPRRVIIAGAPASGKGTQCEMIKERFGVVHLSTGDMLRAAVAAGTPVGMEAKSYMDSGRLVPDSTMIGVVKDRLQQADCQSQGWLLDGFPRTEAQAQALAEANIVADCFIFLNVPDDVLVERVVGRRTDPVTGKIYHLVFSPPPADIVSRLEHRSDDTEDKIKVRLEQFRANVEAVKGSYETISVTIDGNQGPQIVSQLIFEAIDSLVAV